MPKPLKRRKTMITKSDHPHTELVLARLTSDMTRDEKFKNLKNALERSGFTIKPSEKQEDDGGVL